jgi:ABC-type phosphate/phosphonate transport system substrate-binding protein
MYQRPELVEAHDTYWALIRNNLMTEGIDCPAHLSQDAGEMEVWKRKDLVLSQTCGRPYSTILHEDVTLIGTPDFGIKECPPGYYRSAFIIHKDDTRTDLSEFEHSAFAFNAPISQSGYNAARNVTMKLGFFFENKICSGGHLNSMKMIANCDADIAAIDAVSLSLAKKYEEFHTNFKILCWTPPTPSLPYITAKGADSGLFFRAIQKALRALPKDTRIKLMIKDLIKIPKEDYFI